MISFKRFLSEERQMEEGELQYDKKMNQGWWNDDDKEHLYLYHGTHKRNVPAIAKQGISVPDPKTGMISMTMDPHTAHGYAAMSSGDRRGEHSFRQAGGNAVTTPHEDRAVTRFKVPMDWVRAHVDDRLGGNIGMAADRMKDKSKFDEWKKENPDLPDNHYYSTTELRFKKPLPPDFYEGHMYRYPKK